MVELDAYLAREIRKVWHVDNTSRKRCRIEEWDCQVVEVHPLPRAPFRRRSHLNRYAAYETVLGENVSDVVFPRRTFFARSSDCEDAARAVVPYFASFDEDIGQGCELSLVAAIIGMIGLQLILSVKFPRRHRRSGTRSCKHLQKDRTMRTCIRCRKTFSPAC